MPTEVTIETLIEIEVTLPFKEFEEKLDEVNEVLDKAGGDVIFLSADCIIRTWLADTFYDWFDEQGLHVFDHYMWAELPGGVVPLLSPYEIQDDIQVQFGFGPDTKDAALLFKLTFGGK